MLAYCADEQPVSSAVLARRTKVPASYLAKILQNLVRSGIVLSHRGTRGGFQLALPAHQVTLLDVVNAVDPLPRILGCPLGLATHCDSLCPMHARMDEAMAQLEGVLSSSSLADLISQPAQPLPMVDKILGKRTRSR